MARPREAPEIERIMGLEVYITPQPGVGGRIRARLEDFIVREVLLDGSCADISPRWPEGPIQGRGSFLLCVLVKKGLDTLKAARLLARELRIPDGLVGFAGLKDARGLTAQFLTLRGVKPEQLRPLDLEGIRIVPVRYQTSPLEPGQLAGNRFDVVVRGISLGEQELAGRTIAILAHLAELGGLPNFFGHQRFGTARPVTHLVGRELVRGDVRKAVEIFLAYLGPGEGPGAREARSYLAETWDLKGFLRLLPRGFYYERLMAEHLLRRPGDYHGAMRRLPLRLRRLFVQAYQAYLFNRFLSARAREGLPLSEPLPGDWVLLLDEHGLPTKAVRAGGGNLSELRRLTKAGRASVAIPLPGFRQEPSGGRQGEIESAVMEEEGVAPEDFKVKVMPEVSSGGGLRPVLARLSLLSKPEVFEDELGPGLRALRLCFQLPRGSYATCLLREIMKPEDPLRAGF